MNKMNEEEENVELPVTDSNPPPLHPCPQGQVWSPTKKTCVDDD